MFFWVFDARPYCYLREEVNTDHGGPEVLLQGTQRFNMAFPKQKVTQVVRMLRVISAMIMMMLGDAIAKTPHETLNIMKCTGHRDAYLFQRIRDSMHHAGSGW